uniref:Uncharacterized protein n=1 Tax=Lepeophtheirus salmonis TaxID=72036 RepID=A0A0K2TPZ6_LEPSM
MFNLCTSTLMTLIVTLQLNTISFFNTIHIWRIPFHILRSPVTSIYLTNIITKSICASKKLI